jgi:hypothetical protein
MGGGSGTGRSVTRSMLQRNPTLQLVRLVSTKVPHPVCAQFINLTAG